MVQQLVLNVRRWIKTPKEEGSDGIFINEAK